MYDLYIKNAQIIDGSGAPAYHGDLAVKDGRIITKPSSCESSEILDAEGLVLCPGFIDAHCHEDETLGNNGSTLSKLSQGITTVSGGNCGESLFPLSPDPERAKLMYQFMAEYLRAPDCGYKDCFSDFTSLENFLDYVDKRGTAYNYTLLTGHIPLRLAVMGYDNRKATPDEIEAMKALLRETMEHGSRGLSAGLIYSPSCYADESEMIELCKVVAEYGGFYAVHLRNEAGFFEEAVAEAIRTAKAAGCALNLSHHKVCGSENWGKTVKTLQMIRDAQADGLRIYTDVYPYTATGNYLNICLPKEIFANGPEKTAELLRDPAVRAEMKQKILDNPEGRYRNCGGFEHIMVCSAPYTPDAVNKTVAEYARELGKDEFETYFDMCSANGPVAQAAYFAMSDDDLERVLCDDNAVICTDSYDISEDNAVHPRCFGSFPLCLGHYVREKHLMPLEAMVNKMTGKTAEFMGLHTKGLIRDGYDADLVLFNPEAVAAKADFKDSRALSTGIERVWVAGKLVYADQKLTGARPGRFIPLNT